MRRGPLALVALLAFVVASGARADGGPSVRENAGLAGIRTPTGFRYVVIDNPDTAVLARIAPTGRVVALKYLPGRFTIHGVAYDGTATGLSADGKTLVLVRPRYGFPRARTSFLILALPGMFVREAVKLRGDFRLDAISPDGSILYFIQFLSGKDPGRYAVRAYDTEASRLVRDPVVDKSEPDEEMRGSPISRATSADGRWAYTLYDGAGKQPFVHALDTMGRNAVCIDLPALAGRNDLYELRLAVSSDGGRVAVEKGDRAVALIDAKTFRVSEPAAQPSTEPPPFAPVEPVRSATPADWERPVSSAAMRGDAPRPSSAPWPAVGAGVGGLVAASFLVAFRRRRIAALARADR
jgi:hypothetical protein